MKFFIVGGSGFIGKKIVEKLPNNLTLSLNSKNFNLNSNLSRNKYSKFITNSNLIYAAGIKRTKGVSYENYYHNIKQFFNLLCLTDFYKPKIIIFCSTAEVYGSKTKLINENSNIDPLNIYAESKIIQENLLKQFALKNGFKYIILRIPGLYGLGSDSGVINKIIESIVLNKQFKLYGSGNQKRDLVYLDDLSEIILTLLKKDFFNKTINVCTGKSYSLNEIIKIIQNNIGKNLKIKKIKSTEKEYNLKFDNKLINKLLVKKKLQDLFKFNFKNEYLK